MKIAIPVALLICVIFIASVVVNVSAQNLVQYRIVVNGDDSAIWTITQASDPNGTIDSYQEFQMRIAELIDSARSLTQREMSLDNNSLQLSTIWETQSHTTRYQFIWQNFSLNQSSTIAIGDVFQVEGFFDRLYGNGEIEISFPGYQTQSVYPAPNVDDTDNHTLEWLGTQLFVNGSPSITLTPIASPSPTQNEIQNDATQLIYIFALATVGGMAALFAALYFRRRKTENIRSVQTSQSISAESDEEKIIKTIAANGGNIHQSALADQLRFSKAKTSQLLTALEKKGVVTRYKKGRDKIVSLTKREKGGIP